MRRHGNERRIADLRRRLANARKRAAYWSGRPNFCGRGFRPSAKRGVLGHDEQYEMAMNDVKSLADRLEEETGVRPATTDYQKVFREAFAKTQYSGPTSPGTDSTE